MRLRAARLRAETRSEGVLVLLIVLVLVGFSLIIQNYLPPIRPRHPAVRRPNRTP